MDMKAKLSTLWLFVVFKRIFGGYTWNVEALRGE